MYKLNNGIDKVNLDKLILDLPWVGYNTISWKAIRTALSKQGLNNSVDPRFIKNLLIKLKFAIESNGIVPILKWTNEGMFYKCKLEKKDDVKC